MTKNADAYVTKLLDEIYKCGQKARREYVPGVPMKKDVPYGIIVALDIFLKQQNHNKSVYPWCFYTDGFNGEEKMEVELNASSKRKEPLGWVGKIALSLWALP